MSEQKENPGAGATATEADIRLASEKPYIWGDAIATLGLETTLKLKPRGWYHIEAADGRTAITIHYPNDAIEVIFCISPGHANRVRQKLSDLGMAGLIEGAQ